MNKVLTTHLKNTIEALVKQFRLLEPIVVMMFPIVVGIGAGFEAIGFVHMIAYSQICSS